MAFSLRPSSTALRLLLYNLLVIGAFISFPNFSAAVSQVTFAWDENNEPDLAGYRLYARQTDQAYNYSSPAWEGSDTFCTIYDLNDTIDYCFVLHAYDTNGYESNDSNEVCLPSTSINHAPVADAGSDQAVVGNATVFLDGSGSMDPDGDELLYQWRQTGGFQVSLLDDWVMNPSFRAPEGLAQNEVLTFELVVNDRELNSLPNTVTVTIVQTSQTEQTDTDGASQLKVLKPTITLFKKGPYYQAKATVVVVDETKESVVKGIAVEGQWSLGDDQTDIMGDTVTGITNAVGEVKLYSERFAAGTGSLCFTATLISETAISYPDNLESSSCISVQ